MPFMSKMEGDTTETLYSLSQQFLTVGEIYYICFRKLDAPNHLCEQMQRSLISQSLLIESIKPVDGVLFIEETGHLTEINSWLDGYLHVLLILLGHYQAEKWMYSVLGEMLRNLQKIIDCLVSEAVGNKTEEKENGEPGTF